MCLRGPPGFRRQRRPKKIDFFFAGKESSDSATTDFETLGVYEE